METSVIGGADGPTCIFLAAGESFGPGALLLALATACMVAVLLWGFLRFLRQKQ